MKYISKKESFMAVPNSSTCVKEFNAVKCLDFVSQCEISFQMKKTRQNFRHLADSFSLPDKVLSVFSAKHTVSEEQTGHSFPSVYPKLYLYSLMDICFYKLFHAGFCPRPSKRNKPQKIRRLSMISQLNSILDKPVSSGRVVRTELRVHTVCSKLKYVVPREKCSLQQWTCE